MDRLYRVSSLLFLFVSTSFPGHASNAKVWAGVRPDSSVAQVAPLNLRNVQHAYGLTDTKPKQKGTLTVDMDGVTFTGKSSKSVIPAHSIVAVNAGNQRVELWGMKGRLLRMAIPNGGGLAAAGVMHHKLGMLTIEFRDDKGGYHGAVFLMGSDEAERALQSFSGMPMVDRNSPDAVCEASSVQPRSVLVAAPSWDGAEVPAAYRALVYERLVDRLQRTVGVDHVFRDGENQDRRRCPSYTIKISIAGFKAGSQVKRATMGPVGMFVGTTQMTFDATITDASGKLNTTKQIRATVRGESESMNVTDGVAKKLAKHYHQALKDFEKTSERNTSSARPKP